MDGLDDDGAGPAPQPARPDAPLDPIQLVENYIMFPIQQRERQIDNNVGEQNRHIPQNVFAAAQNNQNLQHNNAGYLDFAAVYHISQRRRYMEHHLRAEDVAPGGFFDPHPENEYRPLSPQNSDEDAEVFRLANARRQAQRVLGNVQQYLDEDNVRQQAVREMQNVRHEEVNNNDNFRDHNGYLSPSPSPTPSPDLSDDDESDDEEDRESKAEDMEVEMLMAQMGQMQPNQSRSRKRHNTERNDEVAKKKVTFQEKSPDEAYVSIGEDGPPPISPPNVPFRRNDDDDEGFFGGPPSRRCCFSG